MNFPLASLVRPPARPQAGFRLPSVGPPCIHGTHFRHRATPVSVSLRSSATVAAWYPGPAAPVQGKASIPPVFVSTGSGASFRRDLPGFASAGVHPCPNNGPDHKFQSHFPASTGPASFLADPDHASVVRKSKKTAKGSSHRTRSVGRRSLPKSVQFVFSS